MPAPEFVMSPEQRMDYVRRLIVHVDAASASMSGWPTIQPCVCEGTKLHCLGCDVFIALAEKYLHFYHWHVDEHGLL